MGRGNACAGKARRLSVSYPLFYGAGSMYKGRATDERNGRRAFYGVSFCRNIAKGKVGDSKGKGGEKVKNFVKKYKWRIFVLTKYLRMYYNREDKVFIIE